MIPVRPRRRVLVVDNQDSFVHTIVAYLRELGADCVVRDRSETTLDDVDAFDGVLLSPGPGRPEDTGICLEIAASARRPVLGVCLGHQVIATVFGGTVGRAPELVHGYTSEIHHDGAGVFRGLPEPLTATRYHSLALDPATVPAELVVTARTADGVIMGVRHRERPIEGVQFHPESVLSASGHDLFANWLAHAL
ncbi:MAG TPA: gamma-glutamyl-gamma-aminobutyrate hydrolase family protein [Actinoallomurus sp.]|jgi:para-aminobenzoate synthetase component 2